MTLQLHGRKTGVVSVKVVDIIIKKNYKKQETFFLPQYAQCLRQQNAKLRSGNKSLKHVK